MSKILSPRTKSAAAAARTIQRPWRRSPPTDIPVDLDFQHGTQAEDDTMVNTTSTTVMTCSAELSLRTLTESMLTGQHQDLQGQEDCDYENNGHVDSDAVEASLLVEIEENQDVALRRLISKDTDENIGKKDAKKRQRRCGTGKENDAGNAKKRKMTAYDLFGTKIKRGVPARLNATAERKRIVEWQAKMVKEKENKKCISLNRRMLTHFL